MNYYDELIQKIDNLINDKNYDEAKLLIDNELSLIYVPRDVETKLNKYLSIIKDANRTYKKISDEDLEKYLYLDENHQLLAVDELNKKNLRDYIDVCAKYLKEGTFKNSKALLIDSLIRQEINYEFEYINNGSLLIFNPSKLKQVEFTDGFICACNKLSDYYLKDPSLLKMSMDLLYKECLLYLPKQANDKEGLICANKIIKYVDEAFAAK